MVIILFAIGLVSSIAAADGGKAGNGGDAVICYGKFFSLDLALTHSNESKLLEVTKNAKSAKEIISYIEQHISTKIPKLAETLKDFNRFNKDQFDFTTKRVWISGPPPTDIKDEAITAELPKACLKEDGTPDLVQAVVRTESDDGIVYYYHPSILQQLESNSPVQLSFVLIHEWLRDFTQDPYVIQRVNRMIHTEGWQSISSEDIIKAFRRSGLKLPPYLLP